MAAQLWPQGDDHSLYHLQFLSSDGVTPVDLSGVAFNQVTLVMAPITGNVSVGTYATLAGAVTSFTNVTAGQFTYRFAAADVATPGNYQLVIVVTYGAGDIMRSLPIPFTIVRTQ